MLWEARVGILLSDCLTNGVLEDSKFGIRDVAISNKLGVFVEPFVEPTLGLLIPILDSDRDSGSGLRARKRSLSLVIVLLRLSIVYLALAFAIKLFEVFRRTTLESSSNWRAISLTLPVWESVEASVETDAVRSGGAGGDGFEGTKVGAGVGAGVGSMDRSGGSVDSACNSG